MIIFHERVDEAVDLFESLQGGASRAFPLALEHSRLRTSEREDALRTFGSGETPVLVSVKSLIEGIDVPAADTGISVASTSSVRQRVQALGRVLRRSVTEAGVAKVATMHLIYVRDTVDDLIYGKADWTDLTGADANRYWEWPLGATEPTERPDPPRTPKPTEEQAWDLLGRPSKGFPVDWPGLVAGQEYSVSTTGVVHNAFDRLIANPQGVGAMVAAVRGRPGGRFTVTPALRLVLVWEGGPDMSVKLAGRLDEPFRVTEEVGSSARSTSPSSAAGDDVRRTLRQERWHVQAQSARRREHRACGQGGTRDRAGDRTRGSAAECCRGPERLERDESTRFQVFCELAGSCLVRSRWRSGDFLPTSSEGFDWPDRLGGHLDMTLTRYWGYSPQRIGKDTKYSVTAAGEVKLEYQETTRVRWLLATGNHPELVADGQRGEDRIVAAARAAPSTSTSSRPCSSRTARAVAATGRVTTRRSSSSATATCV